MKCWVLDLNGRARPVKNLGWLLRHWRDVKSFDFSSDHCAACGQLKPSARMVANLHSGEVFLTDWHDREAALRWIQRPVFYGLSYNVGKDSFAIKR